MILDKDFNAAIQVLQTALKEYEDALEYWQRTKAPERMISYTTNVINEIKEAINKLIA